MCRPGVTSLLQELISISDSCQGEQEASLGFKMAAEDSKVRSSTTNSSTFSPGHHDDLHIYKKFYNLRE